MDIFAYAMQMEKDGERFYREIAEKAGGTGIKKILTMLADEEVKHYRAIEKMRLGRPAQIAETHILDQAKNVFVQIKEADESFSPDEGQLELFRKAQDIEKRSRQFYEAKAAEAGREDHKQLFEQLAVEEAKHYFLIENLIDFASRPEQWLEDAEWHHLDEY